MIINFKRIGFMFEANSKDERIFHYQKFDGTLILYLYFFDVHIKWGR